MRRGIGVGIAERSGIGHERHVERLAPCQCHDVLRFADQVVDDLPGGGRLGLDHVDLAEAANVRDVVIDHRDGDRVTVEQRREAADALAIARVEHQQRVGLVERRSASSSSKASIVTCSARNVKAAGSAESLSTLTDLPCPASHSAIATSLPMPSPSGFTWVVSRKRR